MIIERFQLLVGGALIILLLLLLLLSRLRQLGLLVTAKQKTVIRTRGHERHRAVDQPTITDDEESKTRLHWTTFSWIDPIMSDLSIYSYCKLYCDAIVRCKCTLTPIIVFEMRVVQLACNHRLASSLTASLPAARPPVTQDPCSEFVVRWWSQQNVNIDPDTLFKMSA